MPIRLNLLAEAQLAEEMRRKDPVKRAMFMGAACAALMAGGSLIVQSIVMRIQSEASGYESQIQAITTDYNAVMENQKQLQQVDMNIRGLDILASERFLNGSLLNALQKVYAENVQLIRLRTEHRYVVTEEPKVKPRTTTSTAATAATKAPKPATATENIQLVLEARDSSRNPGDQVAKFKESINRNSYFQQLLGTNNEIRLVNLSPPQIQQDIGRPVVQFTLEAKLPEKVRLGISSPTRVATAAKPTKTSESKTAGTGDSRP